MDKMDTYTRWKQNPSKGEVFTPKSLVNEMLDKIPVGVWENPKSTFCDLSMGKGTFLVEIVNRLVYIYGYTEEDAKSRVFGYEVRIKYINYLRRRGYKNLYHEDSLEKEFNMKFDVVIGNPPYQELDDNGKPKGGGKGGGNNLWSKFFIKSKEISDNVFFIHPPSFLSPNHIVLDKMYEDGGLKYLKIFEKSPFDGVGTQACYYHWVKGYGGLCTIGGVAIDLNSGVLPNSSNPLDFSIFNKFFSGEVLTFERNCKIHTQSKKEFITDDITNTNQNKLYVGTKIKYTSLFIDEKNRVKVVISRSGYLNPILDYDSCVSESNYYYLVNNVDEGNNLVNVLKSKLYDYCLKKSKFSGFFHGEVLKNIPKVGLNRSWSDEQLYEYFNLTQEEIEHIENNVK
jgi:site-specific DNA-methyltransferase (adenine-specific)